MVKLKSKLWVWVKSHRKQLYIAGMSVTAIAVILLGIKNKKELVSLWNELNNKVDTASTLNTTEPIESISDTIIDAVHSNRGYTLPSAPVYVTWHIRSLSGGKQHSAVKAAEAAALGIELLPNQTIVDSYTKYMDAA